MAKILMCSVPVTGHVSFGVPLAIKLIEGKHELLWYSGKRFKEKIESTGATFVPLKSAVDYDDNDLYATFPDLKKLKGITQQKYYLKHMFYDPMKDQYNDLKEILKTFHADVILSDPFFTGAIPIAEKKILPWVIYGVSPLLLTTVDAAPIGLALPPSSTSLGRIRNRILNWSLSHVFMRDAQQYINKLRAEMGLPRSKCFVNDQVHHSADLFVQCTTEKFSYKRSDLPSHIKYVGPFLPKLQKKIEFTWWDDLKSGKPVIHVTQGTLATTDFTKLIIPVLEACADMDVLVVVSLGGKPVENIDSKFLTSNVRLESFIPHAQLLPYVDIMITNGGYGGVLTALFNGVPLIAAGDSEEKAEIAVSIDHFGVGINLKTGHPKPSQIKNALKKILSDKKYKENAKNVQADFAKHDPETEVAHLIEDIIRNRKDKI